jgi:hypothetical protein
MLGFRWKKHTTTTCLGSGGKNTQAKKHVWVQEGKTDKLIKKTCSGSGGKN